MVGFGSTILNMLGQKDPRLALAAAALGQQPTTSSGAAGAGATGAPAPAQPGAAQPMQPQAYQSPPDLLNLYSELMDRQTRERRVDTGIGLIASSFAQPENRDLIAQATGMGGGSGGTASAGDPLSQVLKLAENQRAIAEKERQVSSIPAIAATYGIDEETARMLLDNDQLDDFVMEKSKYRDADTQVVARQDGSQVLINKANGDVIMEIGKGYGSTGDLQELAVINVERQAAGLQPYSTEEWLKMSANLKNPTTTINNNMDGGRVDRTLAEGLDKTMLDQFTSAGAGIQTINNIQNARRSLNDPAGVISGSKLSPASMETRKVVAQLFGFEDEAVDNTQTFLSNMQRIVLPMVKQLGTGNSISNADREFSEKMAGANIEMTEGAIRDILNITEKGSRREIIKANEKLRQRIEKSAPDSPIRTSAQYHEVPTLSQEYVESVLKRYDPRAVEMLMANASDPEEIAAFDSVFGDEAARDLIEAKTGRDIGPRK